jgi:4'-phosphopantetheinyl transferase
VKPGVHVWLAPEALADDPASAARLRSLLSDEELAQQQRFGADSPRRQHLVARGLQRTILSRFVPEVAPRDWRFGRGESGRPFIAREHAIELDFNIAHTNGMVAVAAGWDLRLGIDVEAFARRRNLEIARRYFSAREIAGLAALPPEDQPRRFLELWTLKEAYLKAIGTGIAGGLGSMTFDLDAGAISFERAADPEASRWRFHQWPAAQTHLLAVAWLGADGASPPVTCHDFAFDASPSIQDS